MSLPTSEELRLRRNPVLLCAFHAAQMGLFPIAVLTLFLRDELGFGMFEVFLLQSIFALAVASFEFPAGYLADRWGYRRVLLVAAGFAACGWLVYALARDFAAIVCAEVLLAAAIALISGADAALLYESLLALREEGSFARWYGLYRSCGNAAEGTAALAGAYLFVRWPRSPFVLQTLLALSGVALAFALLEPPRERGQPLAAAARVRGLVRFVAFGAPRLRAVIALLLALSLPSYVMVWVLPAYVQDSGINAAFMGPIWAAASYTVALTSWSAPRLAQRVGVPSALALCVALVAAGYAGLGLSHGSYGFLFYFALCTVRGVQLPLLHTEEQRLIPSSDRAALLSLNSLFFRASFMLLGPLLGYALDHADRHHVLLAIGAGFFACAAGAWLWFVSAPRAQLAPG